VDEKKVRDFLQKMITGCGQTIRDVEHRCTHRPDQPPIDVEWFRVMRSQAQRCLDALDSGDMETFHKLIERIKEQKEQPPW
jgi:hypothetical protein